MPQGELYIRTKKTRLLTTGAAGLVESRPSGWPSLANGLQGNGWVDTYLRYGLSLEDGARSKLMTPSPCKEPTSVSSEDKHGVAYAGYTVGKRDANSFSFEVHITAPTKADFEAKLQLFKSEVLECQYGQLRLCTTAGNSDQSQFVRHLLFMRCDSFREFRLEMAKFDVAVIEPHPEKTDEDESPFTRIP